MIDYFTWQHVAVIRMNDEFLDPEWDDDWTPFQNEELADLYVELASARLGDTYHRNGNKCWVSGMIPIWGAQEFGLWK
jgi:hypothetical protein